MVVVFWVLERVNGIAVHFLHWFERKINAVMSLATFPSCLFSFAEVSPRVARAARALPSARPVTPTLPFVWAASPTTSCWSTGACVAVLQATTVKTCSVSAVLPTVSTATKTDSVTVSTRVDQIKSGCGWVGGSEDWQCLWNEAKVNVCPSLLYMPFAL